MNRSEKSRQWLQRLKHSLHLDPQTKDQLTDVLRDAQVRALIDAETLAILEGALAFAELKVRDIMLPKKQMICIEQQTTLAEIIPIVTESGHSRFPVLNEKSDEVIGILHAKDLLRFQNLKTDDFDLPDIVRQAPVVPESRRLDSLLHDFRSHRNHMAIVVDEYGAILGFVTLEDILEQIIGDIEDEFDIDEEANIKIHANAHYIVKAHTPIKEFNEALHAAFNDQFYDTIGGVVMANFGHLPKSGETTTIDDFSFKIISADARRIHLIECIDQRKVPPENIKVPN
ncbi:MAG: CBS domain-containing protein [Gammaproteobacteria bacterium]|nr:CBS domain-containing protein [Gammaproteobacteria bacterium]